MSTLKQRNSKMSTLKLLKGLLYTYGAATVSGSDLPIAYVLVDAGFAKWHPLKVDVIYEPSNSPSLRGF